MTHEVFIDGMRYVPEKTASVHDVYVDGLKYAPIVGQKDKVEPKPEEDTREPGREVLHRWHQALRDLEPTHPTGAWGMSNKTAQSQVGMAGGRDASKRIVDINKGRNVPTGYWDRIRTIADSYNLPPEFVCAIFCRESHHGAALDSRGEGDRGHAFGVGQVDKRYHEQRGRPDPYSVEHMRQCCEIMVAYLRQVESKHPDWADKYVLKGCAVAYNSGPGNVATIQNMDRGTTGNDYGADVLARAQFYIEEMP